MSKTKVELPDLPSNDRGSSPKPVAKGVKRRSGVMSAVREITVTLFEDVVLPNMKSLVREYVVYGIDFLLGNTVKLPEKHGGARIVRPNEAVNYNRMSTNKGYKDVGMPGQTVEVNFATRQDAERVRSELFRYIDQYGFVTLGDFHHLAGVTSDPLDERYGWSNVSSSKVRYGRNGYYIVLPEPSYRG